jgi:hypothetical protein
MPLSFLHIPKGTRPASEPGKPRKELPPQLRASTEGLVYSGSLGAYDHVGGAGIVHAACWAHARRKFFEAVKLNPRDHKISVRDYLGSVLPGLGDFPVGRIAELTPTAWANRN